MKLIVLIIKVSLELRIRRLEMECGIVAAQTRRIVSPALKRLTNLLIGLMKKPRSTSLTSLLRTLLTHGTKIRK